MRTDQNIDFPFCHFRKDLRLLFGAAETGDHFDAYWPVGETVAEVVVMLLREKGGRHQHRHLLVVIYRQESGAHRDFSFPKANIAAHQTIHCQRLTHVTKHRINGLRLIRRGFKREAVAEQLILLTVVFKREALFGGALCVDIQQFCRHITHFFRRFLPRA